MANPKRIETGSESSGVCVEYVKSRKMIYLFGWFDHYVGIQSTTITLADFCQQLGITRKDLPE
jgi:hypothetical protein